MAFHGRDLFSAFGQSNWREAVSSRALDRTLAGAQLTVPLALYLFAAFLLGVLVDVISEGLPEAVQEAGDTFRHGLVSFGIGFAWYAWNWVRSADDLYSEQQAKIADLETSLANTAEAKQELAMGAMPGEYAIAGSDTDDAHVGEAHSPSGLVLFPGTVVGQTLADRLIQFRIDGVKLRNEKIPPEKIREWKSRVDQWKTDVINVIKNRANVADVARFVTLDRVPVVEFKWAKDKTHAKALRELSRRIEILLEIMAKL